VSIPIPAPEKWDAEHPNLYTLTATLRSRSASETVTREVGFRQVEIRGNTLLLNGRQIHLRGSDHHHISPTLGRSTTASLDERDIQLLKDANVNFIRTSHYPPTPA
jgi:beta-galactosidase/beta-glucuronidase